MDELSKNPATAKKPYSHITSAKPCQDHLGKNYQSIRDMCDEYNINKATFHSRMKNKMSLKDALTLPNQCIGGAIEFRGVTYVDEKEMCDAYKILHATYLKRRQCGWSIELSLTTPLNTTQVKNRTGEIQMSRYGQKMTIIEYRGTNDIDVQFEDGYIVKSAQYGQFSRKYLRNPNLQTGYKIPKIAYELNDGTIALYYKCEKCGLSDVGTWQQIAAHQCQKSDTQIGVLTGFHEHQHEHKNKTA